MTHFRHPAKFRWTESLTCRFIQLRRENGKLFTGRKYSAQAGWECILQQMQEEFPTIMADVHYRVLKKKWSNLLQQYKELKNPVHGDRNKADDVSWPFYNAIDEVLEHTGQRRTFANNDEYIDPHEFLCVSVAPEEPTSPTLPAEPSEEIECTKSLAFSRRTNPFESPIERTRNFANSQLNDSLGAKKRDAKSASTSRSPRVTKISIEKVTPETCSKDSSKSRRNIDETHRNGKQTGTTLGEDEDRPRKFRRIQTSCHEDHDSRIERSLEQFFEYARQRDEEYRSILLRIMQAVETIADKL